MAKTYVVVKDGAFYAGLRHGTAPDYIHVPLWCADRPSAQAFASYRDAAIMAKAEGGHVVEAR